jgi:hypothetical protein
MEGGTSLRKPAENGGMPFPFRHVVWTCAYSWDTLIYNGVPTPPMEPDGVIEEGRAK